MEGEDSVSAVVFACKERRELLVLQFGLERLSLSFDLLDITFILSFYGELDESNEVLKAVVEFIEFLDLSFKGLLFLQNFLRVSKVIPEALLSGLFAKLGNSFLSIFYIQNVGKLFHFLAVACHFDSEFIQ